MSYNTVSSTYHIRTIDTDKVLVDKSKEIEILQEKIMSLNLKLKEKEGAISQLMEKIKSKKDINILVKLLNYYFLSGLQFQISEMKSVKSPVINEIVTDKPKQEMSPSNDKISSDDTTITKVTSSSQGKLVYTFSYIICFIMFLLQIFI